jgi:hypothetical protein
MPWRHYDRAEDDNKTYAHFCPLHSRWTWRFCGRASRSTFMATRRGRRRFSRSTCCRASFRRRNGNFERGLAQRITALNLFLHDIYHEQKILKDGVIPPFYVLSGKHFRREFVNFQVPKDIYIHVCGTDLIRDEGGQLSGAGGQRPLSVRRELRAGKPPGDEARVSRHV